MRIVDQSVNVIFPFSSEDAQDGMMVAEYAGRNCYRSEDKITDGSYIKFLGMLKERKHESPLEFCDVVFEITTSRDVMAEITRHRMASFAIQSQRYVKDNKNGQISYVRPVFYGKNVKMTKVWVNSCQANEAEYEAMLSSGANAQDARKVLNNSVATKICMKANLREWMHIMELRDSIRAYPEMQVLAKMIHAELKRLFPCVFDSSDINGDDETQSSGGQSASSVSSDSQIKAEKMSSGTVGSVNPDGHDARPSETALF